MSEKVGGVARQSRYSVAFMIKIISCCGTLNAVHYNCAVRLSKMIDNTYEVEKYVSK